MIFIGIETLLGADRTIVLYRQRNATVNSTGDFATATIPVTDNPEYYIEKRNDRITRNIRHVLPAPIKSRDTNPKSE